MTFYVVHPWVDILDDPTSTTGETYRDWMAKNLDALRKQRIWSVSTDPSAEGWDTDNGYQTEGGLSFDEATALVDAANRGLLRTAT